MAYFIPTPTEPKNFDSFAVVILQVSSFRTGSIDCSVVVYMFINIIPGHVPYMSEHTQDVAIMFKWFPQIDSLSKTF